MAKLHGPDQQVIPAPSFPRLPRWVGLLAILAGGLLEGPPAHAQPAPPESAKKMDEAIAILQEARRRFKEVRDYECRLVKKERIEGKLTPESTMLMKVRNRPFSVYLRFEAPRDDKGMEICYVAGRHEGKMRVHPSGLLGVAGFVTLDVHDSRVMEKSRHCITEAGLGYLLDSTARYWEMERKLNKTIVRIREEELAGRTCLRLETIHPDRTERSFYGYRCVLWLDKSTLLPVGSETYDWPRQEGLEEGDLLEAYRFVDLRCNIGLREDAFPE